MYKSIHWFWVRKEQLLKLSNSIYQEKIKYSSRVDSNILTLDLSLGNLLKKNMVLCSNAMEKSTNTFWILSYLFPFTPVKTKVALKKRFICHYVNNY